MLITDEPQLTVFSVFENGQGSIAAVSQSTEQVKELGTECVCKLQALHDHLSK